MEAHSKGGARRRADILTLAGSSSKEKGQRRRGHAPGVFGHSAFDSHLYFSYNKVRCLSVGAPLSNVERSS
jgi:hypothetical protein